MTAPVWLASPPEVHSALLSSGPGPGPLLAAAGEWSSLSVTYAEAADELAALVAEVETGSWEGPSAATYAAAHAPYLAWLTQASADSAALAAEQQTSAAAYTSALAAMPTLPELAANHATNAVLTATNFFGINTIPIALNEADYMRMWVQAATVMGAYDAVSTAAVAAAPQTPPAPQIVQADGTQGVAAAAQAAGSNPVNDFLQWLWQLYTNFYNDVVQPFINWFANIPFLQAMFSGFDPYLLILGNPLTYLNPLNIAFAIGYPMDLATYVALLSEMFTFVGADLAAAFASGNPLTIGLTIMFVTVEVIGTVITDTIALLKTTLESTLLLLAVVTPLLAAPLVPLAAGTVLAPIGLEGLAALAAAPPPPAPIAPATPLAALAPTTPPSGPSPTPSPVEATASAHPPGPPPTTAAPPTTTGTGVSAPMDALGYLVGDLGSVAKRAAGSGARKKAPEPDSAEQPAIEPTPEDQQPRQKRRRKATVKQLGRGHEYVDLDSNPEPAAGFAGVVRKSGARPAGLIRHAGSDSRTFDNGARVPMMPSTWESDADDRYDAANAAKERVS